MDCANVAARQEARGNIRKEKQRHRRSDTFTHRRRLFPLLLRKKGMPLLHPSFSPTGVWMNQPEWAAAITTTVLSRVWNQLFNLGKQLLIDLFLEKEKLVSWLVIRLVEQIEGGGNTGRNIPLSSNGCCFQKYIWNQFRKMSLCPGLHMWSHCAESIELIHLSGKAEKQKGDPNPLLWICHKPFLSKIRYGTYISLEKRGGGRTSASGMEH